MTGESEDRPPRGRKQRVDFRKNRGKAARDRTWTRRVKAGDETVHDAENVENVRAKGSLSRKRTIIVRDDPVQSGWQKGIVLTMRGLVSEVDAGGKVWACTVRRKLRTLLISHRVPLAAGDEVWFSPGDAASGAADGALPEGVIEHVAPRRATLLRQYERRQQVVAANVDNAVITMAAEQPKFRPHLIDRYLVAIHAGEIRPILCMNKRELDEDGTAAETVELYQSLGYKALFVSAARGEGIDELRSLLMAQVSVFVGPSGVGKSSLINALQPGLGVEVGTLSDLDRGRHTTTTARLLKWDFGGYLVDTPGMRQFELADVKAVDLEAYFIEIRDRVARCRFQNCTHTVEDGCAILAAVEAGEVSPLRHDSYVKMFTECSERERY